MSQEEEIASIHTVYARMTSDLLLALVDRNILPKADGQRLVKEAKALLSLSPVQGELTATAMQGLERLATSIASMP
ncbi:hypothetical protein [Sphingomonas abietis]|uniref:DUF1844 domain-containing protein n=1 Tax=Sphingomonas abietis TaxID=3012344 RepID=A0ABY7NTI5_9SPHN|nr:hypothetical protein [Sphingomonas abietis]WBO23968.1 hypothetical protein PBT88_07615 [Sphingomonas abietis]